MIKPCPNSQCSEFRTKTFIKKDGLYFRRSESRLIQRYKCNQCGIKFSNATGTPEFKQHKRRVNRTLRDHLCSGISMRRAARILKIHRKTVERKMLYLGLKARRSHQRFLCIQKCKVTHLQFDDLLTTEHSKLKPLTVSIAVDADRRTILSAKVEQIGAFGHLADLSRKKYGYRKNKHKDSLRRMFEAITPCVHPLARVESDEHKRYPEFVREFLPGTNYLQHKGGRGCIAGQGELKKLGYDPLFILNHSCAMLRANINRLFRKTWCTTKSPARLQIHLDIFIEYYNQVYLPQVAPHKWGS